MEKIMRKIILILSLVAATWLATTHDASAQLFRGRGIGIGRGGYYGGGYGGGGYYGNGYYGRNLYGGGYGNGYYGSSLFGGGYGNSYYGSNLYGGSYYPGYYGNTYYGNSYSPGYYSTPTYYVDPVVQASGTDYRQSFSTDPNVSTVTVRVPNADAQVWFDDTATTQRGTERVFHTPALQQAGTYTVKARWIDNGRTVDQQRTVQVQPGQSTVVDFRAGT